MNFVRNGMLATTAALGLMVGAAQAAEVTLKLGHHVPAEHSTNREYAQYFADLVGDLSNGEIEVHNYPGGQLGGQRDLLEGLELGTVDMTYADLGVIANYDLALGVLDLPYVFDSIDHAYRAMDEGLLSAVQARVDKATSFHVVGMIPVAFRDTLLADKDVETLDDLKGVKIRTPQAPVLIDTFRALGANPTPIPSGEAYTAIQTHVVDGMEGHKEFIYAIRVPEVAKHWVETKHNLTFNLLNISDITWNRLTEKQQATVMEAGKKAGEHFRTANAEIDDQFRQKLKDEGVTFSTPDLKPFREATAPMVESFVKDNDASDLWNIIEKTR
ncbi:TRAP transporter substrate-binding protein [Consotaella salsifontis]|uniref:Tripartite ATP-independent transporter solute receptor, DctP family n=1 Tax=Consotaella salsifontis TaxID=1365950 RepID=A0A1T4SFT8_9HYPH|nr:TRAP transporter substrate-binding protein [Consotaella salsifontis]SKA27023.1 tripartite ATP-independent transporter solute receptor, DctP family [Consotaella salsifontis]